MSILWDIISKESQDNLIIAMFLVQKEEAPDKQPWWIPPDQILRIGDVKSERGWTVEGKIESHENIDWLMRQPTMKRVKPE